MCTDPIAGMLTRIRNASLVKHEKVTIPHSKLKESIAKIFKFHGLIKDYSIMGDVKKSIEISLKYFSSNRESVIRGLKRISKPGRRVYASSESVPRVLKGIGLAILSTSKGIFTDTECRAQGIGGEVLCYVW
jgi:small subunit ribosomal protein S8